MFDDLGKIQQIQGASSNLLLYFVNDILDFSRIRSNKFQKSIQRFNIREAVQEIIQI